MTKLHEDITFKGIKNGCAVYEDKNFDNIGKPKTNKVYESQKIDFTNYLKSKSN